MALEIGRTNATIDSNAIRMAGDKETVSLTCTTDDGDAVAVTIWLTPKAMGMARRSLKICGYDADKQTLADLDANPNLLQGKRIPIEIEEYNGRLQAKVVLSEAPPKARLLELDKALRDAKKKEAPEADDDIPF